MTINLDNNGLKSIIENYDLFFIDLWGVVHNGVKLNEKAIDVLAKISEAKKNYILLTNAPRPNSIVKIFLEKMGMNKNMRENVYTSGEAALSYLKKNFLEQSFYHIGPPRDFDLFIDFKNKKTQDISKSNYLLCTGLYDNHDQDLNYYKELFANSISKKMICTNPDLIVHRGSSKEYCAGTLAAIFEELGGQVVYFGKPYPAIYNFCIKKNETVLVIGDNVRTDIKGANNMKYDSLFITGGVHKDEFLNLSVDKYDKILEQYKIKTDYYQERLTW